MATFKGQIDSWIKKSTLATEAVVKSSIQELAIQANTPVGAGGRMRVDTGFLRNSIAASVGTLPSGQSIKPEGFSQQGWNPSSIVATINGVKLGQTVYIGWTAEYARYRENRDFFARTAVQNWGDIVSSNAMELRARLS